MALQPPQPAPRSMKEVITNIPITKPQHKNESSENTQSHQEQPSTTKPENHEGDDIHVCIVLIDAVLGD